MGVLQQNELHLKEQQKHIFPKPIYSKESSINIFLIKKKALWLSMSFCFYVMEEKKKPLRSFMHTISSKHLT